MEGIVLLEDIVLAREPLVEDIDPLAGHQWVVDIVHIVLEIDLEKGGNDYLLEDIDLGNLEHQVQDNHKHSDTVDNSAALRRVADKHLLEVMNKLVDQEEEDDEKHRLDVRGYYGLQVEDWDFACWSLGSYPVSLSIAYREMWKSSQNQDDLAVTNNSFIIKNTKRIYR